MKCFLIVPVVLLVGCSSPKPPPVLGVRPLPPEAAPQESLRSPEVVRAYQMGRYVDPNQGAILHERHPIYRIEAGPRWNLRAPLGNSLPPVALDPPRDSALSPIPLQDELRAEIHHQRNVSATVAYKAVQLTSAFEQLQSALKASAAAAQGQAFLVAQVGELEHQMQALQEQIQHLLEQSASAPTQKSP